MEKIAKVKLIYRKVLQVSCVALLVPMLITIGIQVLMRYVFNSPLVWSEEFARFCMIWLAMLATCLVKFEDQHIAMQGLIKLSKNQTKITSIIAKISVFVITLLLLITGAVITVKTQNQVSPAMQIPMSMVFCSIPISAGLILVGEIIKFLEQKYIKTN